MPRWHEQLAQFASDEGQWLAMVLPSQQPAMLLQVLPASCLLSPAFVLMPGRVVLL